MSKRIRTPKYRRKTAEEAAMADKMFFIRKNFLCEKHSAMFFNPIQVLAAYQALSGVLNKSDRLYAWSDHPALANAIGFFRSAPTAEGITPSGFLKPVRSYTDQKTI